MSSSRKPARFTRPAFKEPKPISEETFKALRAAAARVYIDKNDPDEKSSVQEVKNLAAGKEKVKIIEDQYESGMDLLASVAIGIDKKEKENEKKLGKKTA